MSKQRYIVFDVESVGLHGEGYAVGYVTIDAGGNELFSARYACRIQDASGNDAGRAWATEHAGVLSCNCRSPREVRENFWRDYRELVESIRDGSESVLLAADVPWPVEANFLSACIADNPGQREWQGPYPIIDVASVRFARGLDPLASVPRMDDETPQHDPLADARQSARLMIEAMNTNPAAA